jgi:hypothetical protein
VAALVPRLRRACVSLEADAEAPFAPMLTQQQQQQQRGGALPRVVAAAAAAGEAAAAAAVQAARARHTLSYLEACLGSAAGPPS